MSDEQVKRCRAWAADLWSDGKYRDIVDLIEQSRPIIPTYDYKTNNVEEMKFRSAQAHLHELIMRIIKPTKEQL
jgi:hypothetical protein